MREAEVVPFVTPTNQSLNINLNLNLNSRSRTSVKAPG
jgi:hypothetical protein